MSDHLSPTQISTWKDCPALYEQVYVHGRRQAPSGSMHLGSSFHKAAEAHNRHKVSTRTDLPMDELEDRYTDAFRAVPSSEIHWDESADDVYDDGAKIVRLFGQTSAREVQPVHVEQRVLVPLEADEPLPPLLTVLDLIDDKGAIRDYKTSGKAPSAGTAADSEQLTAYALAHKSAFGHMPSALVLDYFIRPQAKRPLGFREQQPTTRGEGQLGIYLQDVRAVASQIAHARQTGLFPYAATSSWKCAEKFCGFWKTCPGGEARRTSFAPIAVTWDVSPDATALGTTQTQGPSPAAVATGSAS